MDARSIRFSHWPWCTADESPVGADGSKQPADLKRHFLHQCGCPVLSVFYTLTQRTDAKCGYPAFIATEGSPRKIFRTLEHRTDIPAYDVACAGAEGRVILRSISAKVDGRRSTRDVIISSGGAGVEVVCQTTSESISDFPENGDCDVPEISVESAEFTVGYTYDAQGTTVTNCQEIKESRETRRVVPGPADVTETQELVSPPPATETERVNILYKTTYINNAIFYETNLTPVYQSSPCGQVLSGMDGEPVAKTVSSSDTVCLSTNHDVLSDEVTDYTLMRLAFEEGKINTQLVTAYTGIQTDEGRKVSQNVKLCLLLENLLVGVKYQARITFKRRTRTLNATGYGFDYGPWELDSEIDYEEFEADKRAMVLDGEWLNSDTQPSRDEAVVEYEIPEDALQFESVIDAEIHNSLDANLRAELPLVEAMQEGYEYAVHEAVVWPTTGTHIHEDEDANND